MPKSQQIVPSRRSKAPHMPKCQEVEEEEEEEKEEEDDDKSPMTGDPQNPQIQNTQPEDNASSLSPSGSRTGSRSPKGSPQPGPLLFHWGLHGHAKIITEDPRGLGKSERRIGKGGLYWQMPTSPNPFALLDES